MKEYKVAVMQHLGTTGIEEQLNALAALGWRLRFLDFDRAWYYFERNK